MPSWSAHAPASSSPRSYSDGYRAGVQAVIDAKVGEKLLDEPTRLAPVIDIMDAIRATLAKSQTPAESNETAKKPSRRARKTPGAVIAAEQIVMSEVRA